MAALMTAMRQVGAGSQGGAEALTLFHQLIFDEWTAGSLEIPFARTKVDGQKLLRNGRVERSEDLGGFSGHEFLCDLEK